MRKGEATRAAILGRAVDIGSTEGLESLTIGRLAEDLGMSKSGLFAHFGSKEELQLATVQAAAERFVDAVIKPGQEELEGAARLRAYCARYLDYLEQEVFAGGCVWAAAGSEFDDRPGPVRDAIGAGAQAWLAELERQARQAGIEDARELAFEVYSLGLGANACARLFDQREAFASARAAIERRLAAAGVGLPVY
jgi:AcrR family transcriptional regulator